MRTNVPPDLLSVVNATRPHEEIHVSLKVAVRIKVIGNVGVGKLFENFRTIRFETCVVAHPEWRRSRKREHVRQKYRVAVIELVVAFRVCIPAVTGSAKVNQE